MTTSLQALATLSRRVARFFHRLFSRLTRKANLAINISIAIPPFFKISLAYKADLGKPANDNKPRKQRSA